MRSTINSPAPRDKVHPRVRHYPHHVDYLGLEPEFRPFVMFTDQPNYRSASVNTDKFGLREQYDASGEFIDLETVRSKHLQCNVLLGGSTVFGVDASSDRTTLSQHLHRDGVPCISLGFRAATSQQELIMFLLLKRYLNGVLNVVLVTGVNDCALAARAGTLIYPGFGGIFYEGTSPSPLRQQELFGVARYRAARIVDRAFIQSRVLRGALKLVLGGGAAPPRRRRPSFEEKLGESMEFVDNTLDSWGQLQSNSTFKVHFVLQPAIGWTKKRLTPIEDECFRADVELFPETLLFSSETAYRTCRQSVAQSCQRNGIDFHDANAWLDEEGYNDIDIFTDVCHLSDTGNRILAGMLRERLEWREA